MHQETLVSFKHCWSAQISRERLSKKSHLIKALESESMQSGNISAHNMCATYLFMKKNLPCRNQSWCCITSSKIPSHFPSQPPVFTHQFSPTFSTNLLTGDNTNWTHLKVGENSENIFADAVSEINTNQKVPSMGGGFGVHIYSWQLLTSVTGKI